MSTGLEAASAIQESATDANEGSGVFLQPLLMDEILDRICLFLGFNELKRTRTLSSQWDKAARKALVRRDQLWLVYRRYYHYVWLREDVSTLPKRSSYFPQVPLLDGRATEGRPSWAMWKLRITYFLNYGHNPHASLRRERACWANSINEVYLDLSFEGWRQPDYTGILETIVYPMLTEWCPSLSACSLRFRHEEKHLAGRTQRPLRLEMGASLKLKRLALTSWIHPESEPVDMVLSQFFSQVVLASEIEMLVLCRQHQRSSTELLQLLTLHPTPSWTAKLLKLQILGNDLMTYLMQRPLHCPRLRSLSVIGYNFADCSHWFDNFAKSFPNLRHFAFCGRAGSHCLLSVATLPNIKSIDLYSTATSDCIDLDWLHHPPGVRTKLQRNDLKSLNLGTSTYTLATVAGIVKHFPNLERLNLLEMRDSMWHPVYPIELILAELSGLKILRNLYIRYPFNTTEELLSAVRSPVLLACQTVILMQSGLDVSLVLTLDDEQFRAVLLSQRQDLFCSSVKTLRLVDFSFASSQEKEVEEFVRVMGIPVSFEPLCPCYMSGRNPNRSLDINRCHY